MCARGKGTDQADSQVLGAQWAGRLPDEDDDRGRLGHGPDQAAHTHHTEEG